MKHQPTINIHNQDCMEAMAKMADNAFELAIIDPPYGKDIDNEKPNNFVMKKHYSKRWDSKSPNALFFYEIRRVSKNQIIWGGNHFVLPGTECMIVWDKINPMKGKFSDAELAWTSFSKTTRIYKQAWIGFGRYFEEKQSSIHPTQKPVKLYKWLLKNYAKESDKILDTHLGSGSIAIACHDMGFDLEAYEIDQEYHQAALQRLNTHRSQLQMF